nr:DNA binding protein [Microvirus sp.]
MKYLYCVKDVVAKEVGPVFVLNNDDVAKRMFTEQVISKVPYPSDYELLCVGVFNETTGEILNDGHPFLIDVPVVPVCDKED